MASRPPGPFRIVRKVYPNGTQLFQLWEGGRALRDSSSLTEYHCCYFFARFSLCPIATFNTRAAAEKAALEQWQRWLDSQPAMLTDEQIFDPLEAT